MSKANQLEFIKDAKTMCKKYGFKLIFEKKEFVQVDENVFSTGYFDEDNQEIVVARNNPDYLASLVHEVCHLQHMVIKSKEYEKEAKLGSYVIDDWLAGNEYDQKTLKKAFNNLIDLELAVEKMAVNYIKDYKLDIDIYNQIKKANNYLLWHRVIFLSRKWSLGFLEKKYWEDKPASFFPPEFYHL